MISKNIKSSINYKKSKIAIIGLGYVGLPLALEFGKKRNVIGFDINRKRIDELSKGFDTTLETTTDEINVAKNLTFTDKIENIRDCQIFIVTVPTPIDAQNKPDLNLLKNSSSFITSPSCYYTLFLSNSSSISPYFFIFNT